MSRPRLAALSALVLAGCLLVSSTACAPSERDTERQEPWVEPSPTRPQVDLEFRLAEDLSTVTGTERITFTPDLEVCELVFRAWPNKPATARSGSSLEVTSARVGGVEVTPEVLDAGAPEGSPGTLVELPLPACVEAGTPVEAALDFRLQLGTGTDERVGVSEEGDLAWLGTAYPLLAWEHGRGWSRDDAVDVVGETVTSETFELSSLRVVAPQQYRVLGVGEALEPQVDAAGGPTLHEFRASAVRDVTVTVGAVDVVESTVGGTVIHVGGPAAQLSQPLEVWADVLAETVADVSEYLGPVPDTHIWVSFIPDQTQGIEFPGAIQFGRLRGPEEDQWLVTHEVAHLWIYGLVGNNQASDPWMDESFASFVQQVVDDPDLDPEPQYGYPDRLADEVGRPMEYWTEYGRPSDAYVSAVYSAGADMLIEARRAAGREEFDGALRDYLRANAHRIATPADVEDAFATTPDAVDVMRQWGALD